MILTSIRFLFPLLKTVNTILIFPSRKYNQLFITENTFPVEMATPKQKETKALNKKMWRASEEQLAQDSNVPRSEEDYISQISEKIEGRVTKKLSQQFSRTENRILRALARLDDFLTNR